MAHDLDDAKAKMQEEADKTGVEHFVFDLTLEMIVATNLESSGADGSVSE